VGVEFIERGGLSVARAEQEVILSAGTYESPHLLMLSGLGPAVDLRRHGIPVVEDLPSVGGNLQDHAYVLASWTVNRPIGELAEMGPEAMAEFAKLGKGPLSSNLLGPGGFIRSRPGLLAPDVQFHVINAAVTRRSGEERAEVMPQGGFSLCPCVLRPASRGRVMLASADVTAKPRILNNYYLERDDLNVAIEATRIALRMAGAPALASFQPQPVHAPGAPDGDTLESFVRESTSTVYHPVGTCAMARWSTASSA
jgi:choline dehydrogenase